MSVHNWKPVEPFNQKAWDNVVLNISEDKITSPSVCPICQVGVIRFFSVENLVKEEDVGFGAHHAFATSILVVQFPHGGKGFQAYRRLRSRRNRSGLKTIGKTT